MADFEEDGKPFSAPARGARPRHEIGQMVDTLSLNELRERIEELKAEVARLEGVCLTKEASKRAADTFFKS